MFYICIIWTYSFSPIFQYVVSVSFLCLYKTKFLIEIFGPAILFEAPNSYIFALGNAIFLEGFQNIRANPPALKFREQMDFNCIVIGVLQIALDKTDQCSVNFNDFELMDLRKITVEISLLITFIPAPYFLYIGAD